VLAPGSGREHPSATDLVTIDYAAWNVDGKMFGSSVEHGQPAPFLLNEVIRGATEGVQPMVEGQKMRFCIP